MKGSMLRTHGLRDFSKNTCSMDEAKAPEQLWDSVQTGQEGTSDDGFYGSYTPKLLHPSQSTAQPHSSTGTQGGALRAG